MSERFYGTYTPRLDDKARLTLPHRYREAFKGGTVVVRGRSRCLYVFTTAGFDDFAEEAINAKVTDPAAIGQARYMLANSDEQTPDAQGRILLSARMREFAGLDRDVVLTGQGHRMEIWDASRWAAYEAEQEAAYVDADVEPTAVTGANTIGAAAIGADTAGVDTIGADTAAGSPGGPPAPGPAERPGAPD